MRSHIYPDVIIGLVVTSVFQKKMDFDWNIPVDVKLIQSCVAFDSKTRLLETNRPPPSPLSSESKSIFFHDDIILTWLLLQSLSHKIMMSHNSIEECWRCIWFHQTLIFWTITVQNATNTTNTNTSKVVHYIP